MAIYIGFSLKSSILANVRKGLTLTHGLKIPKESVVVPSATRNRKPGSTDF